MRNPILSVLVLVCGCAAGAADLDPVWPELTERLTEADKAQLKSQRDSVVVFNEKQPNLNGAEKAITTFVRPYWEAIDFNTVPEAAECHVPLALNAAKGEREICTLGIFPNEDVRDAEVAMDDLVSAHGEKLSGALWKFAESRYLSVLSNYVQARPQPKPKGLIVVPAYIVPGAKITLHKGVTRQVWAFVRIPTEAAAGVYTGKLRIKQNGAEIAAVDVRVRVYPFELKSSDDSDFGWFYGTGPNMPKELALLADHGFNAVSFPVPKIKIVNDLPVVDFTEWDDYAKVCKEQKMNGRHIYYALQIARHLPGKEFSPSFMKSYKSVMQQIFDWSTKQNIRMLAWVVDEPRERDINPWNRNYDDTIKYLENYKGINGALTMASPMRDLQNGKNYVPMVDKMDVLYTHPWQQSKGLIAAAKEQNKPFISYNSVRDRLSFGFGTWKIGASGRWQWHFKNGPPKEDSFKLESFTTVRPGWSRVGFPTKEEAYSTPALECTGEGVDDYRYLRTLEDAIKAGHDDPARKEAVLAGERLLESIKTKLGDGIDGGALKSGSEASGEAKNPYERSRTAEECRMAVAAAIAVLKGVPLE